YNPAFLQSVRASNRCYPAHFFVGQNDQSQSNPVQRKHTVHVRFRPRKRDVAAKDQHIQRKDYISDRSPHREQLSDGGSVDEVNQKNDSARPEVHSLPLIAISISYGCALPRLHSLRSSALMPAWRTASGGLFFQAGKAIGGS